MNKLILSAAVASTLWLGAASAHEYNDVATVLSATPIFTNVATPRQQCWSEQVSSYEERRVVRPGREEIIERQGINGGGALLGAIVGGVIGHQFGSSTAGRDHGTAAGAILGGVLGANAGNGGRYERARVEVERVPVVRDVQRCNTVNEVRQEISAYDVRYRYHDREYQTQMAYDPGRTMPINVEIRPSAANGGQFGAYRQSEYRNEGNQNRRDDGRQPMPSYSRVY